MVLLRLCRERHQTSSPQSYLYNCADFLRWVHPPRPPKEAKMLPDKRLCASGFHIYIEDDTEPKTPLFCVLMKNIPIRSNSSGALWQQPQTYIWSRLLPCRTSRQRSALMMSNAHFLFVAHSYINIKRLRERERKRERERIAFDLWLSMDRLMRTASHQEKEKNTIPMSLKLGDSRLLLLLLKASFASQSIVIDKSSSSWRCDYQTVLHLAAQKNRR